MNQYQQPLQQPYGYPPPHYYEQLRHRKPLRRWATIIGLGLILNIVISFVLGSIWAQVAVAVSFYELSPELLSLLERFVSLFIYVGSLWPSTLFILAWIKIPPEVAFPLKKPRLAITLPGVFVCLGVSVLSSYLTGLLSVFIEFAFGVYPIPPDFSPPVGIAANIVYVISMTLAPAVFEELLFRGAILQTLRRFGDGFALVVSSILFSLMHGNLSQIPGTFLVGLLIGYFVLRTGSLLPGMAAHFVNNALVVAEIYVSGLLNDAGLGVMNISVFAGSVLFGALALLFLALRVGGLFRLAPSEYPLPVTKRIAAFFLSPAEVVFILIAVLLTMLSMAPVG